MTNTIEFPGSKLLLSELLKLNKELKPHYPEGRLREVAALRKITSVFLASNIFPLTGKPLENPIRHPAIKLLDSAAKLLDKTAEDIHYAYYANIPPMTQIYPHVDISPYYNKINRYQVFFDLTEDQVIVQDGSAASSNSIVWFNPSITHSFINNSATDSWNFVVFDIYK